ncbi:P-type H+-ATPase, putative [Bodo saltans]|uniref:P-type H+-ATPase, putative n=1 Tax=Bodo saltans TaxID=75058 RepID=A0A0S4JA10_BODSA|nr:P-type H+-ATPase, putative [Bodo saltans]|eukprot:CUG87038.1 P-type H+-ATPase, putative [Bodo saltans]
MSNAMPSAPPLVATGENVPSTLQAFALMSTPELSSALHTSLDALDLWSSQGKAFVVNPLSPSRGASRASTTVGSPVDRDAPQLMSDEPLTASHVNISSLVREEAIVLSQLIESASDSVHGLSCVTMTDDETSTIRSLPRATLEALILASCATHRAQKQQQGLTSVEGVVPPQHPFGSILGPQFEALVAVKKAKHSQVQSPPLLPLTTTVQRNGTAGLVIPTEDIEEGDLLILRHGDVVPCDALLLASRPIPRHTTQSRGERSNSSRTISKRDVFVNTVRISGSTLPIERRDGCFQLCDRFGSMSILPQQSIIEIGSGPAYDDSEFQLLAVALRPAQASSWMARQVAAVSGRIADSNAALMAGTSSVELLPLFIVPIPSIHQFQRCAMLRAATCQTVIIEVEGILLDENAYSVTSAVWGGQWYSALNGVRALMHNKPVDMASSFIDATTIGNTSHISAVDTTVQTEADDAIPSSSHQNTRHAVHSFVTSASQGSRVAAMATGPGLHALVVAMMMASSYEHDLNPEKGSAAYQPEPSMEADAPSSSPSSSSCSPTSAIRQFLKADAHINDVLLPQYQPISDAAVLHLKGRRITARLFGYTKHLSRAARGDTQRHAVLVVYGDARTVLKTSAFMASPKGQIRIDRSTEQLLQSLEESAVCMPEFLFGVATADILWDYVGTKNIPTPTDLAALLAQTTSLCYQGALVCEVGVRRHVVEGVQRMSLPLSLGGLGMQVVLASTTRTSQQLRHLLLRRCRLSISSVELLAPDALGRWLTDTTKFDETRSIVGFAAGSIGGSAHDIAHAVQGLFIWCRQRTSHCLGVVFCGHGCNATIGFSLADVAFMVEPQADAVCRTVLRNAASVSVSGFGIDDVAEALLLAREHINQCPQPC